MLISHRNTEKSVWPDTGFRVAQAAQARPHKISPDTGSLWVPGLCEGLQNDFVKHDVDRQNEHRHGAGPGKWSGALGRSRKDSVPGSSIGFSAGGRGASGDKAWPSPCVAVHLFELS